MATTSRSSHSFFRRKLHTVELKKKKHADNHSKVGLLRSCFHLEPNAKVFSQHLELSQQQLQQHVPLSCSAQM